jgi:hypothetical protein
MTHQGVAALHSLHDPSGNEIVGWEIKNPYRKILMEDVQPRHELSAVLVANREFIAGNN